MLYITEVDTKYGYPVKPVENKFYQLSGKAWRRNGGSGSATFNFYFADDLLATKPVSKKSLTLSGNNVVNTFNSLRFVALRVLRRVIFFGMFMLMVATGMRLASGFSTY